VHQGQIVGQAIDGGVVYGARADEEVRIRDLG